MPNEYITKTDAITALGVGADILQHGETHSPRDKINAIPAADVVEVVRCKDCKHYSPHPTDAEYGKGWCRKLQGQAKQDFYCAAGAYADGGEQHAD